MTISVGSTMIVQSLFQAEDGGLNPTPTLHVLSGTRKVMEPTVDWMIRKHYLGRWPGTVMRTFRLDRSGVPVGTCVFSLPPRETFARYGVSLGWELSRLWIDDSLPKNTETWFVAKTIQWIKKNRGDVECLISYADPAFGHSGVIYRAGNWVQDGMTDENRETPRFDYVIRGGPMDGKLCLRRAHVPPGATVERVPRVSKFRYVYWLKKSK